MDLFMYSVLKKAINGNAGTKNYEELTNLPQIDSVELKGNQEAADLNLVTKEELETETQDLLRGLEKTVSEEDPCQSLISVKDRNGATSIIVEVDNLDIENEIAQHSVLGSLKGQEMDTRIANLEVNPLPVIELEATMTSEEKAAHTYPTLTLNEDQIATILGVNVSMLKVTFNITVDSGTETDVMVFYTTIDSNKIVKNGSVIQTIKINAVRANDEANLIYHSELLGNETVFYPSIDLTPTYITH